MRNSNNKIVQYTGYFLLAFFVGIIAFSFGMPDMTSCGTSDQGTIAVVNGKKIHTLDFLRYRDMKFSQFRNQKMDSFILDNFIVELLLQQKAENEGFTITDDRISRIIKNSPDFKNPSTGKFDAAYFQAVLRNNRLSIDEYEKIMRREIAISDMRFMINTGAAVPKEEIASKAVSESSSIQIQYAFLSNDEIKKRYAKDLTVSDADIDSEIAASKVKISDPKTDREKIKKDLEDKKLEKIKNDLTEKINAISSAGGSFSTASAVLNGKVSRSATFKIGEPVKTEGKDSKEISAISKSPVFTDKCLALNINAASPVISSGAGLYIFTPVLKSYKTDVPDAEKTEKLKQTLASENITMITRNLLKEINEESKIIKNLKTD
ncbi:MAG TPA: SurA N-terminal domain-containing protein [Spirochaetota bacterium]|nr:SurA N-terminal domain-containing protein [Spirochaetota bacterium]HPF06459.1 SurA N-terminal domain-containing protein [Spirochaetota bacterium]HPJ42892.1 SurA N-terminal domain-containing protein [Spirochaetota bacterium]HPR37562.1 SurA N-terminal domain-containing protein [Spirochaetota bacterium]HRX47645.1 SurA N-terminal domain-containing protein [Spirochaetota bacterium]